MADDGVKSWSTVIVVFFHEWNGIFSPKKWLNSNRLRENRVKKVLTVILEDEGTSYKSLTLILQSMWKDNISDFWLKNKFSFFFVIFSKLRKLFWFKNFTTRSLPEVVFRTRNERSEIFIWYRFTRHRMCQTGDMTI